MPTTAGAHRAVPTIRHATVMVVMLVAVVAPARAWEDRHADSCSDSAPTLACPPWVERGGSSDVAATLCWDAACALSSYVLVSTDARQTGGGQAIPGVREGSRFCASLPTVVPTTPTTVVATSAQGVVARWEVRQAGLRQGRALQPCVCGCTTLSCCTAAEENAISWSCGHGFNTTTVQAKPHLGVQQVAVIAACSGFCALALAVTVCTWYCKRRRLASKRSSKFSLPSQATVALKFPELPVALTESPREGDENPQSSSPRAPSSPNRLSRKRVTFKELATYVCASRVSGSRVCRVLCESKPWLRRSDGGPVAQRGRPVGGVLLQPLPLLPPPPPEPAPVEECVDENPRFA